MSEIAKFVKELIFSGLEIFGRYYSTYRAIVADNKDPNNTGRCKLIIPEVGEDEVFDYWAPPKGIYSGKDYGMQAIPRVGDLVWVEFENGFPERPIYNLGYFSSEEVPKDTDLNDVNNFWFKTPGGITVQLNDTKKSIIIKTSTGDNIEINSKAISLVTTKKISLGSLNRSAEPALLGDKTEDALNQIYLILNDLSQAITLDIAASANQPFLVRPNLTKQIPKTLSSIVQLKTKIGIIKSKKITLD